MDRRFFSDAPVGASHRAHHVSAVAVVVATTKRVRWVDYSCRAHTDPTLEVFVVVVNAGVNQPDVTTLAVTSLLEVAV
jgi:hypothetical protein